MTRTRAVAADDDHQRRTSASGGDRRYRIGEVSDLTGVSVRALHHYDRIGLLRPPAHSESGYRLYGEADLLRLQQILTLRYLGFRLREIAPLLDRDHADHDLIRALVLQGRLLRERITELQSVERALDALLQRRLASGAWAWADAAEASAVVWQALHREQSEQPKGSTTTMTSPSRFTPEQRQQFADLATEISTEDRESIERGWLELVPAVRAARHLDPTDPAARALADRWHALLKRQQAMFAAKPGLWEAIGQNMQQNLSDYAGMPGVPDRDDFAFIARVDAARD